MTRADLAAFQSNWSEPATTTYRGVGVHAIAENTQGLATLQLLNMLERFDMRDAGFQTPLSIHLGAEAKRLAYEDRARWYGDPNFSRVPVEWLISKDYAAERAKLIARTGSTPRSRRPGAEPGRHHLFHRRRPPRHDGVADPVRTSAAWARAWSRRPRLHVAGPRAAFTLQDGHPNVYAPASAPSRPSSPASPRATASPGSPSA
jgi:gamma-glutamyltranspeptidase/glutathione hydrolase